MLQFISPPVPHYIISGQDTYQAGDEHPERSHIGVFDLLFVTTGCLYITEDNRSFTVSSGRYVILNPNSSHRSTTPCIEETHFFWLHFNSFGTWYEVDELEGNDSLHTNKSTSNMDTFVIKIPKYSQYHIPDELIHLMKELQALEETPSSTNKWKQQKLFSDLMFMLHLRVEKKNKNHHENIAESAAVFLRQHYKDAITYKSLSEALHFHENYIAICMKNTFGMTPLEYLTQYRIEQAKRLLIHTNKPIGKIAEETGFNSFPYFIRCFTKLTKCKPMAFRNQYR